MLTSYCTYEVSLELQIDEVYVDYAVNSQDG